MRITENAGTPLYAAAYITDDTFVVGGGGGQGAHGVRNKLAVYKIGQGSLKKESDFELPQNSDSPTSMAAGTDGKTLWVGANTPAVDEKISHLAQFNVAEDGSLKLVKSYNQFRLNDVTVYQKSTSVAGNMVASASSSVPGLVTIFNTADGDLVSMKFEDELVGAAVADYDDKAHKFVAAASESHIDIRTVSKPGASVARLAAPRGEKWSRITAVGPSQFVAASTVGSRQGAKLTVFEVGLDNGSDTSVKETSCKIPGFKGVTALASSGSRIAVASPGGDVIVYDIVQKSLRSVGKFKGIHKFPVTSLALSPDGSSFISTSLDGSLVLHCGLSARASMKATIGWVTLSALVIAIIALVLSYTISLESYDRTPSQNFLKLPLHKAHLMGHGPVVHPEITPNFAHQDHAEPASEPSAEPAETIPRPSLMGHGPVVHKQETDDIGANAAGSVAATAPEPTPETPEVEGSSPDAIQTPEDASSGHQPSEEAL